ncbi:hypothetical protein ACIPWL_32615 [Streptomyces sp. NPDC090023]|uniref:hypothetical protein n=1 Tax=unclassified Streptomyces TaxID=2593676 RepID=UPI00380B5E18
MSTTRRQLGTGPNTPDPGSTEGAGAPRLLPVERADVDEHQEHDDPRAQTGQGPVTGRRVLGGRGR